jgi:hypothetical protein
LKAGSMFRQQAKQLRRGRGIFQMAV